MMNFSELSDIARDKVQSVGSAIQGGISTTKEVAVEKAEAVTSISHQVTVQAVEKIDDMAVDINERMQQTVESALLSIRQGTSEAERAIKEGAESAERRISEVAESGKESIKDAVENANVAIKDGVAIAQQSIRDSFQLAEEKMRGIVQNAEETIKDVAQNFNDMTIGVIEEAKRKAEEAKQRMVRLFWKCLIGLVALDIIISVLSNLLHF